MFFIAEVTRMSYKCDKENHTVAYSESCGVKSFNFRGPQPHWYKSTIGTTSEEAIQRCIDYMRAEVMRCGVNPADFTVGIAVIKTDEIGCFWRQPFGIAGQDYNL